MPNGRDNQNSPKKTRLFSAKNSDATVKNNTTMKRNSEGLGTSISEMLDTEYRGVSLYTVAIMLLVIAILWTGVSVVDATDFGSGLVRHDTFMVQDDVRAVVTRAIETADSAGAQ